MNKIILMGRLVAEPEIKTFGENKVCEFKIAINRKFKKDEADFITINAWNKTGEFVAEYFNKGSMIALTGRLEIQTWKDKEDNFQSKSVVITEDVYFTGSKNDTTNSENSKKEQSSKKSSDNSQDPLPF